MRDLANREKVTEFMRAFGRLARSPVSVYFTGGATAVLEGWRDTTLDIDIKFDPELDEMFRGIADIKERLRMNVELAAPSDFIPELPGWRERSTYIGREGQASFYNYDPYSQALAKIERGHEKDLFDVEAMFAAGLVGSEKLLSLCRQIEPLLYRYPALNSSKFGEKVERFVAQIEKE